MCELACAVGVRALVSRGSVVSTTLLLRRASATVPVTSCVALRLPLMSPVAITSSSIRRSPLTRIAHLALGQIRNLRAHEGDRPRIARAGVHADPQVVVRGGRVEATGGQEHRR